MTQRTPPTSVASELGAQSLNFTSNEDQCTICDQVLLYESQECYIISTCDHIFHRQCVEQSLSSSSECPHCKIPCELSDLRKYNQSENALFENHQDEPIKKPRNPPKRGKIRGALSFRPNTRSISKTLSANILNNQGNTPCSNDRSLLDIGIPSSPLPPRDYSSSHNKTIIEQPVQNTIEIDYSRINSMIESNISKILANLNLSSNYQPNGPIISSNSQQPNTQCPGRSQETPSLVGNPSHVSIHNNTDSNWRPEKITAIVQNWNVKFDGSSSGLTVDEFLYRIKSLTAEQLDNNFKVICKNLPVLLTGKAREWYWRYHKQVDSIHWDSFCAALKCQYKDMRSSFDIKEEIRSRKMKPGETFEMFYDAVSTLVDRLSQPMPEEELVEILLRNLRPEIRHELIYVPVFTIAHLRNLVQKREKLFSDEHYRKNIPNKTNYSANAGFRRNIADIENPADITTESNTDSNIHAISHNNNIPKCWNCEEVGHFWDDCLRDRTIFCYGCGTKNVYKPQCSRCANRKLSTSKNLLSQNPPQNRQ